MPVRVGGAVAVAVAAGADAPHEVGEVGVRGAEPPVGGRAVRFAMRLFSADEPVPDSK